jgi:hypothetical protein
MLLALLILPFVLAVAGTHAVAGVSSAVFDPADTGVLALSPVLSVAGTLACCCRYFCCCCFPTVTCVHALSLVFSVAGTYAVAGFLLLLALLLLVSLHCDVLAVACYFLAHAGKVFRSQERETFSGMGQCTVKGLIPGT